MLQPERPLTGDPAMIIGRVDGEIADMPARLAMGLPERGHPPGRSEIAISNSEDFITSEPGALA